MASNEELEALAAAGRRRSRAAALELMITHHAAGAVMIDAVLQRTDRPEVTELASRTQRVQTTEIATCARCSTTSRDRPFGDARRALNRLV